MQTADVRLSGLHALLRGDSEGGNPVAGRMTHTLKRIEEALLRRVYHDVKDAAEWLGKVVNGWPNYFAVNSTRGRSLVPRRHTRIFAGGASIGVPTEIARALSDQNGCNPDFPLTPNPLPQGERE